MSITAAKAVANQYQPYPRQSALAAIASSQPDTPQLVPETLAGIQSSNAALLCREWQ